MWEISSKEVGNLLLEMNPELRCDRSNATEFSEMCLSDAAPPQCYSVAFYELR